MLLKLLMLNLIFFSGSILAEDNFTTWQEMKFQNLVRQSYDFSCGMASLITLFNYQFGRDADEHKLLVEYLKTLPKNKQDKVKEDGLTLLELKKVGEYVGFDVFVVRITLQALVKSEKPALVYVEVPRFKHFAVFKGLEKGKVFMADPSLGNRSILPDEFMEIWKGQTALFLISKKEKERSFLQIKESNLVFPQYETARSILSN